MNNTATVHSRAWYGDEELTLNFPTGWEVEILGPKDAPVLPHVSNLLLNKRS